MIQIPKSACRTNGKVVADFGIITLAAAAFLLLPAAAWAAPQLPEIRITATNNVPACVTPDRLMSYLKTRNNRLDPRFANIAQHYKSWGEGWHVRWDYAFFQMVVETNFLSYRRPDGRMGDVDPKQNNFAGIGTTGGGVPGDGFTDVKTGVLAQIQHLVVYSGERLAEPVAPRTQLKQDDIIEVSQALGRPVRFSDLARRWAVDKNYGQSIEWAAEMYRSAYCKGGERAEAEAAPAKADARQASGEMLPWQNGTPQKAVPAAAAKIPAKSKADARGPKAPKLVAAPQAALKPASSVRTVWSRDGQDGSANAAAPASAATPAAASAPGFDPAANPPAGLGASPAACVVRTASYGGKKTLLVRTLHSKETRYTALTVLDGFEQSMTGSFLKSEAVPGETIGEYATSADALAKARELCPAT